MSVCVRVNNNVHILYLNRRIQESSMNDYMDSAVYVTLFLLVIDTALRVCVCVCLCLSVSVCDMLLCWMC